MSNEVQVLLASVTAAQPALASGRVRALAVLAASGGPGISVVGPGWYLSGALVALVMAAAFALQLNRALLRRARG